MTEVGSHQAAHCYRHPQRETMIRCTRCDRPICTECMRPASVGFHCPDDVVQGRRTQRPLRNMLGAKLVQSPPYATVVLIAVNVAIYVVASFEHLGTLRDPTGSRLFIDWQLFPTKVHDGEYYRLLTSGFLHLNLLHIATNMLSLAFVGPFLERQLGMWRFLSLYFLALLGGSAAVYAFGSELTFTAGASGALFGLLGACVVLVRRLGLDAQWLVGIIVLNFVITFSVANISKLGHIGGFVTGMLVGLALGGLPARRSRVPDRLQVGGLAGVAVLVVVVVAIRTSTF